MNKQVSFEWLPGISVNLLLDNVALLLSLLVLLITFLVMVFSSEYMKGDHRIGQYFAYLSFFALSMIGLILSDHLILLFIFWELVGFSSYLLIGFWYQKEGISASQRTAFMINRIADVCLLAGILLLSTSSSLNISELGPIQPLPSLLIAIGAFGKSAQLPFSGWLVKAMVGPTPVSALIHAATMVAAGVYLLIRLAPAMDEGVLLLIALAGALTAFYGALSAIKPFDIKKILAYSTVSQLGYMMVGIGCGSEDAALFHLWTHAFFKAGLFLTAGAIMHYMHYLKPLSNPQDMRAMGGLKAQLPVIFMVFVVFASSLMGLPLFSGFLSKEAIIVSAFDFSGREGGIAYLVPLLALVTVLLTAFYVIRMLVLIFLGQRDFLPEKVRVSARFSVPLMILAVASLWWMHSINPLGHAWLLSGYLLKPAAIHPSTMLSVASIGLVAAGGIFAFLRFNPTGNVFIKYPNSSGSGISFEGFYLDSIYSTLGRGVFKLSTVCKLIDRKVIDGIIHLFGVFTVVFAKAVALIDRFIIDGPVKLTAWCASFLGNLISGLSARQAQTQLVFLIVGLILILGWILFS